MADEVEPFGDGADDQQRTAGRALIRAEHAEHIGHDAQRRAVDDAAHAAVRHRDRLTDQEQAGEQCRAGQDDIFFQIEALADIFPRQAEGRQLVQIREEPRQADDKDKERNNDRKLDVPAHKQEQPAGHHDQRCAGAYGGGDVAGQQVHRAGTGQTAIPQSGVHALDESGVHAAEQRQLRAGNGVREDVLRPRDTGHDDADGGGMERIVALAAERLLDEHGDDDGGNNDGIRNAGRHQQRDERGKALTGRLMGLVARAVQRGQGTVAQVGGQQCGQQQKHRARTVVIPRHADQRDCAPQQVTVVAVVRAAFNFFTIGHREKAPLLAVQDVYHSGRIHGMEQRASGHEPVDPGSDAQGAGLGVDAAVHLDQGITAAAGALGTDGGNARGGGGEELLPAETGLHAHDQDQIDNAQIRENSFHRCAGADADADLAARSADSGDDLLCRVRHSFEVEGDEAGPCPGKVGGVAGRVTDHQVDIVVDVGHSGMQAFQHRRAVADIGYKVPVHHVKVHQVDTGLQQAGAVMFQVGKISRQDRCGNFRHNVYTPLIVPLCCT